MKGEATILTCYGKEKNTVKKELREKKKRENEESSKKERKIKVRKTIPAPSFPHHVVFFPSSDFLSLATPFFPFLSSFALFSLSSPLFLFSLSPSAFYLLICNFYQRPLLPTASFATLIPIIYRAHHVTNDPLSLPLSFSSRSLSPLPSTKREFFCSHCQQLVASSDH